MTLLFPQGGEIDVLNYMFNITAPQTAILRLYENNITPANTDTAATYTEATFTGYAAVSLAPLTWGAPVGGNPSSITYGATVNFTSSAAQSKNVYGYYMTRTTSGVIILAERAAGAPLPIVNNGDVIHITPVVTAA